MEKQDRRTVVVTGGASGIGEGTARRFAASGDRVHILDRNRSLGIALAEELGAEFHDVDVTDPPTLERAREAIGDADILVPSAGVLQNAVNLLDMSLEEADTILRINYLGVVATCQIFGRPMKQRGGGAIVLIASLTSYRASAQPAYCATKAAMVSLTETLAAELGPHGVRVNAVAPGYTLTQAMQQRIDEGLRDPAAVTEASALGRFVMPEDVGNAIYFLCSDEASAITGVTLPVDAGWLATTAYAAYAAKP